jgi:DNA-binding response OmpR family regulator
MATVLVVDDEPIVREVVVRYLERDGHRTLEAADVESARDALRLYSPSLVVLDLMLPGGDGLELCREIRAQTELPVIMLTARADEADRIVGLELGADDYVTKPFSPRGRELRVAFGELELDTAAREVFVGGALVQLTAKEFDLLEHLARHPKQVFSRRQLMELVWGYEAAYDTGTVTVHVRRLREKIERDPANPRWIETVWGVGYRFRP